MDPKRLLEYWPQALKSRIENDSVRAIHIPFKKEPVFDAIGQFDLSNKNYPKNGYCYYTREAHQEFGHV